MKPLATIPELDLTLYSRCLVCRMNEDGTFASLEKRILRRSIIIWQCNSEQLIIKG